MNGQGWQVGQIALSTQSSGIKQIKKQKNKNVEVLFWQGFGILWESLKLGKNTISSMGKQNCQTVKLKNGQHSV